MSQSLTWKQLRFASLLAYCPRPADIPEPRRAEAQDSRNLGLGLKSGRLSGNPPESVARLVGQFLARDNGLRVRYRELIPHEATLVPVPSSALPTRGGLWVPKSLAEELVRAGFGSGVAALLERTEAIPKAAQSLKTERPSALRNFQTLRVRPILDPPARLVLVDDIVSAGATLIGSANRLATAFPSAEISAFAAARTVSSPTEFRSVIDPVEGTIRLSASGRSHREP